MSGKSGGTRGVLGGEAGLLAALGAGGTRIAMRSLGAVELRGRDGSVSLFEVA